MKPQADSPELGAIIIGHLVRLRLDAEGVRSCDVPIGVFDHQLVDLVHAVDEFLTMHRSRITELLSRNKSRIEAGVRPILSEHALCMLNSIEVKLKTETQYLANAVKEPSMILEARKIGARRYLKLQSELTECASFSAMAVLDFIEQAHQPRADD